MKHKRWIFAVMAFLIVLAAQPVCSFAASGDEPGFVNTEVRATVEPFYLFSLPPDVTIRYPNTSLLIGQFGVTDLLLQYGEQLSIDLIPDAMTARGTGGTLPYTVSFNPPAVIDKSQIGQYYDVVITINAAAFAATPRTYHDAELLFRVRSSLTGEVIWQGTTTVTARRAQPGDDDDGDDGDGDDGDDEGVPDTGDNTIPGEEVPQGDDIQIEDGDGQKGEIIPNEEIPVAQPAGSAFWWWWIPVAVLAVALLGLIFFLIFMRRRKEEDIDI